jgi:hypothetical protein
VLIALMIGAPAHTLLHAQPVVQDLLLELGAMDVQQPAAASSAGALLSVLARRMWPNVSAEAHGVFVSASGGAMASQLGLSADARVPRVRGARLEVGGALTSFGAFARSRDDRAAQSMVLVRQHVEGEQMGVFVGTAAGRASGFERRAHASAIEFGTWATRGIVSASLSAQRAQTTDWLLMESAGYVLSRRAAAYHLQDAALTVRAHFARADVAVSHAWRAGLGATNGSSRALSVGASWHLGPQWSLALHAGSQLADVVRGLPEARINSISLRWRAAKSRHGGAPNAQDLLRNGVQRQRGPEARAATAEATLEHAGDSTRLVVHVAANAGDIVEIAGTFNEWQPLRLVHDGARHSATVRIASGSHRIALRINGAAWRAPRGLVRIPDGLGGESGVLIVP